MRVAMRLLFATILILSPLLAIVFLVICTVDFIFGLMAGLFVPRSDREGPVAITEGDS